MDKKDRNAIILMYCYVAIANGMFVIALWITNNLFKSWAVIALIVMIIIDIIGCVIWTKYIHKKIKNNQRKISSFNETHFFGLIAFYK